MQGRGMTEFDIVMITKNSVKPCLEESLKSIEEAVNNSNFKPRLIIIDGYSTDETLKVIENHVELNPKIIFDDGNRATARQKGVEYVSSEFFAFIDSDVVLTPQWFNKMILHFEDPEVGAVWGAAIQTAEKKRKYFEAMAKFYGKTPTDMMKQYVK